MINVKLALATRVRAEKTSSLVTSPLQAKANLKARAPSSNYYIGKSRKIQAQTSFCRDQVCINCPKGNNKSHKCSTLAKNG